MLIFKFQRHIAELTGEAEGLGGVGTTHRTLIGGICIDILPPSHAATEGVYARLQSNTWMQRKRFVCFLLF